MGPGVARGPARPAGPHPDAGAAGRPLAGPRAPGREPESHDDRPRAHAAGPGAAGGPRALYPERATRASARRSERRPGPGPLPGLRDVPPDGPRAEAPDPDPSLHVSSSGATAGVGDSIASHRRGGVGHGAAFALRGD